MKIKLNSLTTKHLILMTRDQEIKEPVSKKPKTGSDAGSSHGSEGEEHERKIDKMLIDGGDEKHGSQDSKHTHGSMDSPAAQATAEIKNIITSSARFDHVGAKFLMAKERVEVKVEGETRKKKQGDHVTAYAAFLEFLFSATADKELKEISSNLIGSIKAIIPDVAADKFDAIAKAYQEKIKNYKTRAERKEDTAKARLDLLTKYNLENEVKKVTQKDIKIFAIDEFIELQGSDSN